MAPFWQHGAAQFPFPYPSLPVELCGAVQRLHADTCPTVQSDMSRWESQPFAVRAGVRQGYLA
eukprot:366571-Chlamydomonas_euryale.AAC.30